MKSSYVAEYERLEREHWWWLARRHIVLDTLASLRSPSDRRRPTLLDVGCGAGINLAALVATYDCTGLEPDPVLVEAARQNSGVEVAVGKIGVETLAGWTFDNVLLLDVIEHIDDDVAALRAAARLLAAGGHMLINVPAMPALWSVHDEVNDHKRRYRREELARVIKEAGLRPQLVRYWGSALVPPVYLARRLFAGRTSPEEYHVQIPGVVVRKLLVALVLAEYRLLRQVSAPFGLSLLAVVSR